MGFFIFLASLVFALAGCLQLYRYFQEIRVELGNFAVPVWVSGVAGVVLWILAIWGFVLL